MCELRRCLTFALAPVLLLLLGACAGLPSGGERPVTTALKAPARALLPTLVRSRVARHPGQSGLHPLGEPHDALAARLVLIDQATCSLDVQYFIWNKDLTGRLMVERLLRAADRGVRVRVLLDDLGSMTDDAVLMAFDHHPNVEVRLFNPVAFRTFRVVGMAADLGRINRRMHNKSFTADGVISIVGGRNIGDEYFAAHAASNFADLDVAVIGPVVDEVSDMFDLYWNHRASVPVRTLAGRSGTREQLEARRKLVLSAHDDAAGSAYGAAIRGSAFVQQMRDRRLALFWGRAWLVCDHPDKVLTPESDTTTHLAPRLREDIQSVTREMFLVSPYFVPRKAGVASLAAVRRRGARVVVVTNSLASTDGLPVHSAYQRYRKALLRAGVELYEIRPDPAEPVAGRGRGLRGWSGSGASSGAALHAKTFVFDRRLGFIGSFNLDPRSNRLNTETGVLFDCPALARRMPEGADRRLARGAYRVELDGNRLVWVTEKSGREVRLTSEPGATWWKRFQVAFLSCLPIEGQL